VKEGSTVSRYRRTSASPRRQSHPADWRMGNLLRASREPTVRENRPRRRGAKSDPGLEVASRKEWLPCYDGTRRAHAPMGSDLKALLFGGQSVSTKVALFPLENNRARIRTPISSAEEAYFCGRHSFWRKQNEGGPPRAAQPMPMPGGARWSCSNPAAFHSFGKRRRPPRKRAASLHRCHAAAARSCFTRLSRRKDAPAGAEKKTGKVESDGQGSETHPESVR